jgi:sugar fermentation stimulation protein A
MDKNRPEPEKSFYLTMNLVKAFIISRPNRFCLICRIEKSNEPIRAYLPNPGRMKELVFPGVTVLLQQNNPTPLMDRKTTHTAVFLIKNNSVYLIHSAMANDLVQTLINKEMISSLKNYTIERREFCLKNILENKSTLTEPKSSASKNISSASKNKRSGTEKKPPQSRIDFLLSGKNSSKKALLEVKNCNFLVNKTALFPDAPSIRASRHLIDLQACSEKADFEIFSLILITGSRAEKFCPNFNTDPLFSKTCFELSKEQGGNLLHIPIYLDIQFSGPDTKEQEYTFKLTPFQAYFDRELLQDRLNDSGSYVSFN